MNYEYPPLGGGGGIAHQDIAEALSQRHEIRVLTTRFRGLPRTETRRGVQIQRVQVFGRTHLPTATLRSMVTFAPAAFLAGLHVLREFRPQVIHAFFAVPSGLPAVWLHRWSGVPLVLTLVGADVYDPNPTAGIATHRHPLVRAVVQRVIRSADVLTAISQDTRRRALEYHHAPRDIMVIPLGLVPPLITERPPVAQPTTMPVRLVTVGRLIPRKAHHNLLAALAALDRKDVTLDIVGDGPLREELQETARSLNIADRVTFHGNTSDEQKWKLLLSADCFVSSSLYEGFGIVFLEAMFAGLPIVATDTGGQTDFLHIGENALLVPPQNVGQLVAALNWILHDASLRARMAEANRAKAGKFLISEVAARYEDVFRRVAQHARV